MKVKKPSSYCGDMGHMGYMGHYGNPGNYNEGHNTVKHPGFKAVQKKIAARSGVSMKSAGAILANSSRHASAAAKKRNPNLKKVRGGY